MEEGKKYLLIKYSKTFIKTYHIPLKKLLSLSPNQDGRRASSGEKLDFNAEIDTKKTVHRTSKTSTEEELHPSNETMAHNWSTTQTSLEDGNTEDIIDDFSGHNQTSEQTLPGVRWYGKDTKDDSFETELSIPSLFVYRYSHINVEKSK